LRDDPSAESLEAWIIRLRREFHQYPELSFKEYDTQKRILKVLGELGIESRKIADTGVLARIRGTMPGPCIALRTDTDGLEVQEELTERNREYISRNDGVMHACGHDGHMAMLFGAARLFLENRDFPGEVRLIFQPTEEIPPGGSERVIAEGGLEGVDAVMGMHILPLMNPEAWGCAPDLLWQALTVSKSYLKEKEGISHCQKNALIRSGWQ